MSATIRLEDDQLVQLAGLVAEALHGCAGSGELLDAATLAKRLGVSREFVYRHQRELGGQKIGSGPKAPIRFGLDSALKAYHAVDEPGPRAPQPARPSAGGQTSVCRCYP